MTRRLEAVDRRHPQTVALVFGPLVLFAVTDRQPVLTRADLLAANLVELRSWQVKTSGAPIKMLPFTALGTSSIRPTCGSRRHWYRYGFQTGDPNETE
jgi:hypothetical protein